mmetsp:Transcript_8857/g.25941  ORF Transcript_8857/g.25941 Transcript_8857/m.25941 type:complete len:386 (+) Transcript_8857:932-2089(+)
MLGVGPSPCQKLGAPRTKCTTTVAHVPLHGVARSFRLGCCGTDALAGQGAFRAHGQCYGVLGRTHGRYLLGPQRRRCILAVESGVHAHVQLQALHQITAALRDAPHGQPSMCRQPPLPAHPHELPQWQQLPDQESLHRAKHLLALQASSVRQAQVCVLLPQLRVTHAQKVLIDPNGLYGIVDAAHPFCLKAPRVPCVDALLNQKGVYHADAVLICVRMIPCDRNPLACAFFLELFRGQCLPEIDLPAKVNKFILVHVTLIGEVQAKVPLFELLQAHLANTVADLDQLNHCIWVANPPRLEPFGLPSIQAFVEKELVQQLQSPLLLLLRLFRAPDLEPLVLAFLPQLSQGQGLPDDHQLVETHDIIPPKVFLLGEMQTLVPLLQRF